MSISDMPARSVKMQAYNTDGPGMGGQRVSIHGGQGVGDGRWTPYSDDGSGRESGPKKYGKAIRMTWEIKSVTDVDVVDVRPSRFTPPGAEPSKATNYV
jgi:hypothetical protein